jgi:hypothetical protein
MNYWDKLWSWDKITVPKLGILVFLIIVGTYLIFDVYPYLRKNYKSVKNVGEYCVYGCSSESCKYYGYQMRGSNYHDTQDTSTPAKSGCLITGWELSHFVFHTFLGYYFNLYISLMVGIGYELYEVGKCDCHSGFDIIYNTTGAMLGNYFK